MSGAGFIADMIIRARNNAKLLRGRQLFKNSEDHSPFLKDSDYSKSEFVQRSYLKFYNKNRKRRRSEKLGYYLSSIVIGILIFILTIFTLTIVYSFIDAYLF